MTSIVDVWSVPDKHKPSKNYAWIWLWLMRRYMVILFFLRMF